jgi:hypothetical protein
MALSVTSTDAVHTWKTSVTVPGLSTLPADPPVVLTGDNSVDVSLLVSAGTTAEIDVGTIDLTKVVSFVLHSTQVAVTVNTNDVAAAGGQSIALGAAKALGWNNTMTLATPLTENISKFFVINGGAKDTVFRAGFLLLS